MDQSYSVLSRQLIKNALITPDGTEIRSNNRHDYVTHLDKVTGKTYMVDGGIDYIRRSIHEDQINQVEYLRPDDHVHNRTHMVWGTRGIDGKQPLTYKPIKDLDTDHIEAILDTQHQIYPWLKTLLTKELEYRNVT